MFAGIERFRKFGFLGNIAHHQIVDGTRLPHARLPDQQRGLAIQIRPQRLHIKFCRHRHDGITNRLKIGQAFLCCLKLRQVFFIEHDEWLDPRRFTGNQTQIQEHFGETRSWREDDDRLIDIGRECFFPPGIFAKQYVSARMDFIDACVPRARYADFNKITAGDILFLALAGTHQWLAVLAFRQILATKVAGDESPHQRLCKASSFAAQMKSLSVMPPASWVEYATTHLL